MGKRGISQKSVQNYIASASGGLFTVLPIFRTALAISGFWFAAWTYPKRQGDYLDLPALPCSPWPGYMTI